MLATLGSSVAQLKRGALPAEDRTRPIRFTAPEEPPAPAANPFDVAETKAHSRAEIDRILREGPPLDLAAGLRYGAVAMVVLPAGVVLASLLLPDGRMSAPGLRRIDSWLVFAPLWAWAIGREAAAAVA